MFGGPRGLQAERAGGETRTLAILVLLFATYPLNDSLNETIEEAENDSVGTGAPFPMVSGAHFGRGSGLLHTSQPGVRSSQSLAALPTKQRTALVGNNLRVRLLIF